MSPAWPALASAGNRRLVADLAIALAAAMAGAVRRSPWTIALAMLLFAVVRAWQAISASKLARRAGEIPAKALSPVADRVGVETIAAAACYVGGLASSMLLLPTAPFSALAPADVGAAVALVFLTVAISPSNSRPVPDCGLTSSRKLIDPSAQPWMRTPHARGDLDIDPAPVTLETFFASPSYLRSNTASLALERRGLTIQKPPFAASEEMIAAAEHRLGVRLPVLLRRLYAVMNGGYVGDVFVPLTGPRTATNMWRPAFCDGCFALEPVDRLRTLADHRGYLPSGSTPLHAKTHKCIVLQARANDMTLLDFSDSAEPRVLIVDFDKPAGADPTDVGFASFEDFFAALRRRRTQWQPDQTADFGPPLGEVPADLRGRMFWGKGRPHAYLENARRDKNGPVPQLAADDALIASTEARLGLRLPSDLLHLWRLRNGGGVSCRFIDSLQQDGAGRIVEALRFPAPMEYFTTLAELSDRIVFPAGEMPWKTRFTDPERWIVLEADHGRLLLLDCRHAPPDDDVPVRIVDGLDRGELKDVLYVERFSHWLAGLRPRLRGIEGVSLLWTPDVGEQEDAG